MIRKIKKVYKSQPTKEGAGVHLKRAFGNYEVNLVDPFLLLDDFHSDNPEDYIAGFPWHPHRGIETITYMLQGKMEHGDSLGNGGIIQAGDVQWMTAGSGIIHQEMPQHEPNNTLLWGFQLWANLPASHKMMDPRYRELKNAQIPEISLANGVKIKIICGEINGTTGPVQDIVTNPEYLDVSIPPMADFTHKINKEHTIFAYLIEGKAYLDEYHKQLINAEHLVIFGEGDEVRITTKVNSVRFLLISGKPLKEPIAWYGPIVMNTEEELQIAFEEYQQGTFIKHS
jgi:redox-sensitive bicupin YhaK (pirin superfamily)